MDISIAIFSYNRGSYVKNCLESIALCLPEASVTIYDDGSTDAATADYLKTLDCQVVNCRSESSLRHGGLYENMQRALQMSGSKYILFLQDDTQFVRMVDQVDLACIENFFDKHTDAAFINPVFLKGHRRKSINKQLRTQANFRGYFHEISEAIKPRPVSMYYCDVVLAHVDRLKSLGWEFVDSETDNAYQARKHFSKMLQLADPFIMHVPEVPVFRGKKSTFGARLAEKLVGSDIKTFKIMSERETVLMRDRGLSLGPYAEDYLRTVNSRVHKPYRYNAINVYFYTRLLHKLEYGISRLLKR